MAAFSSTRVHIDTAAAQELGAECRDRVARDFARELRDTAMAICPKRTGRLMRSHQIKRAGVGEYVVVATAPYSLFVHDGHRVVAYGNETGRYKPPNRWLTRARDMVMVVWQ